MAALAKLLKLTNRKTGRFKIYKINEQRKQKQIQILIS